MTNVLLNGSWYPALVTRILVFGAKDLGDIPKTLLNFRRVCEFSLSAFSAQHVTKSTKNPHCAYFPALTLNEIDDLLKWMNMQSSYNAPMKGLSINENNFTVI